MPVVIHLGGEKPSRQLAESVSRSASLFIAADSGYDLCRQNGLMPGVVTGDFDSIDSVPDNPDIRVVPATEQTATDFEKALRLVPNATSELVILGGTGLRSDHFLTNLLIASARPSHQSIRFIDDLQSIYRVTPDCPFCEVITPGTVVSLIPFPTCDGVTTSGLQWNLSNQSMDPAVRLGQSNVARKNQIAVRMASGRLFVVVNQCPIPLD